MKKFEEISPQEGREKEEWEGWTTIQEAGTEIFKLDVVNSDVVNSEL